MYESNNSTTLTNIAKGIAKSTTPINKSIVANLRKNLIIMKRIHHIRMYGLRLDY